MALIDLQTNLKSLRFGKDRFGGGDSGQPFIKTPIDEDPSGQSVDKDFLLRGGLSTPLRAGLDTERLTRYFTNLKSPSGFLFVAKQNLLSQTAVKTQSDLTPNEGVYTPLSTLAQSLGGYAGFHAFKQGLNPFQGVRTYSDAISPGLDNLTGLPSIVSIENNRLVNLYNEHVGKFSSTTLRSYQGGPNSVLGVGTTNILFATDNKGGTLKVLGNDPINESFIKNQTGISNREVDQEEISGLFGVPLGVSNRYSEIKGGSTFTSNSLFEGLGIPGLTPINNNPTNVSIGITGVELASLSRNNLGFINDFSTSVYKDNELTPKSNLKNYLVQRGQRINPTSDFISPLGVSIRYANLTGGDVLENEEFGSIFVNTENRDTFVSISKENGLVFQPYDLSSVYERNTLTNTSKTRDNNSFTLTQDQISDQLPGKPNKSNPGSNIQDFRNDLPDNENSNRVVSVYNNYNNSGVTYEGKNGSRVGITSPGLRGNRKSYTAGKIIDGNIDTVDKINSQPIYRSSSPNEIGVFNNDLVKFRIAALDNSRSAEKNYIIFRAFIDSFSDGYSAEWSAQKYMGRGEPLYQYGGFDRQINLAFTVAAQSKPELMAQYKKLNYLASNLAPYYSSEGYMSGNLVELTMGGWCYELPGFIKSLTLDVPQESTWEIGIDDDGGFDSTVKEMPHMVKVSGFVFIPIHTFRPEKQILGFDGKGNLNEYGKQRYLQLSGGDPLQTVYETQVP